MAEVLVIGKKISEMGLVNEITGEEKVPTSALGDKAVTTGQLLTYLNNNGVAQWGRIGGDITNQVDLQNQFTQERNTLKSYTQVVLQEHIDATNEVFEYARNNGSALPYKEGVSYEEGAVVVKDGMLQQWKGGSWRSAVAEGLSDTIQTFNTTEAGVDPVAGVADGAYYNVRSSSDESYLDEYQNVGGVATPTGKSYPSSEAVQKISDYTALPFVGGRIYRLNERVQLENGDIVKSTVGGNTNNPNSNMTGWENLSEHNTLKNRGVSGAHPALAISDASGENQQDINDKNKQKNINLLDFFTSSELEQYNVDPLNFDIQRAFQEAINSNKQLSTKISFPPKFFNLKSPVTVTQDNLEIDLGGSELQYTGSVQTAAIRVTGSAGLEMAVTSDIAQYSTTFTLSSVDAATLSKGDYVKISTTENYFVISGRDYKKGEIVQVESVSNGIVTITSNGFQLPYASSFNIKATKLNLIDKFTLKGGKFYGTGEDGRQILLLCHYVTRACVNSVDASNSELGVIFRSVVGGTVVLSDMHDIDRGGTGYAISVEGASQHIIVSQNNFKRNRHSFTTGGYDGVCMNILVSNNIADDHNAGAVFNTHGNARFTDFKHNVITDAVIGISCYSPCNNIIGNTMSNIKQSAVYQTEAGGINSKVNGNTIDGCSTEFFAAITFTSRVTECETNRYVECNDNTIVNCRNGTGIGTSFIEAVAFPEVITVNGNTIRDYGFEAILLKGGVVTTVAGNTIFKGYRSTNYAIDIENRSDTTGYPYGNTININGNNIGQAGRGISVTNAALLNYSANIVRATNAYRLTLSNVTTLQGDVLRSPDGTLYKLSVADGGTLSTAAF